MACQLVSATYIITWSNIKIEEKLTSSLIKHSKYITEANITRLIRQLVEEAQKTKLVLECSYCFEQRSDGIIPMEPISGDSSLPDHSALGSSTVHGISEAKSLPSKDEKPKKTGRKTTTEKLLEEAAERVKMSGDLEKIQAALQAM